MLDETALPPAARARAGLLGIAIALACLAACGILGLLIRAAVYGG